LRKEKENIVKSMGPSIIWDNIYKLFSNKQKLKAFSTNNSNFTLNIQRYSYLRPNESLLMC